MGFDAVVFDSSSKPFDENVSETKQAVEAVKSINPSIIVEGEIGDIGSGSEIHETGPKISRLLTTPEEAAQFVAESGIDVLAPAVGNMHGLLRSMARGEVQKRLDIGRIQKIKAATGAFMTLHGGSGTNDDDRARRAVGLRMSRPRQLSVMAHVFVVVAHGPNFFAKGLNTAVPSQPPTTEIAKMLKGFRTTVRGSPARPK